MPESHRRVYPTFPASCWWPLRERFKRSMPAVVDTAYLAEALGVDRKTARNLVPMLREMGLIDRSGAPLDRAFHWRVDGEYPSVCRRIRDEIYPASLRVSVPEPATDFDGCFRWFMTNTGVGEAAARRMARFYVMLSQADATAPGATIRTARSRAHRGAAEPNDEGGESRRSPQLPSAVEASLELARSDGPMQIIVQLQLTPETTREQIDQVFSSLARHLGNRLS